MAEKNISQHSLLIISHTPHYLSNDVYFGFGPTVREINELSKVFSKIFHIAPVSVKAKTDSELEYNKNVELVPIDFFGGNTLYKKILVFWVGLKTSIVVLKYLKKVDYFHFRAPTSIGLLLIPLLSISRKRGWFKFGGNWDTKSSPVTDKIQKILLNNIFTSRPVTINGSWPNQKSHLITFENPCLYDYELAINTNKRYDKGIRILFVGRLTKAKGFNLFKDLVTKLNSQINIEKVYIVGSGPINSNLETKKNLLPVEWYPSLSREQLKSLYKDCHILVLPSEREGFPKVVAEASAFGCVPIVTDLPAVKQYINSTNGIVSNFQDLNSVVSQIKTEILQGQLKEKSINSIKMANLFTYERYVYRIKNEVLPPVN